MPTLEEEKELRQSIKTSLSAIASTNPGDLARENLGDELNFREAQPYVARTIELFRELAAANLEPIPALGLNVMQSAIANATDAFRQVNEFSLSTYPTNAPQQRQSLIARLQNLYSDTFSLWGSLWGSGVIRGIVVGVVWQRCVSRSGRGPLNLGRSNKPRIHGRMGGRSCFLRPRATFS